MISERVIVSVAGRPLVSELRFHSGDGGGEMPPYRTACNLIYESATVVEVSMLNGERPRAWLRDLVDLFLAKGVATLVMSRAEGHGRLRGVARPDGRLEISVPALAERLRASSGCRPAGLA